MGVGGGLKTRLMGPALGAAAAALILLASLHPLYRQIELKTLDMRFASRPAPARSAPVLHVDIDDRSISAWGRWPWPRERHATLIRLLQELGAGDIFFDVEFPSESNPADDNALAAAMRERGGVFVACLLELYEERSDADRRLREGIRGDFDADAAQLAARLKLPPAMVNERLVSLKRSVAEEAGFEILRQTGALNDNALLRRLVPRREALVSSLTTRRLIPAAVDHCLALAEVYARSAATAPESARAAFPRVEKPEPPIALIARAAEGFGVSNTPADEDGVVRHVFPFYLEGDRLLPHLSLVAAMRLLGAGPDDVRVAPGERILLRPRADATGTREWFAVPIDARGRLLVNWPVRGGVDWPDVFAHVPYGTFLELRELRRDIAGNAPAVELVWRDVDRYFEGKRAAASAAAARLAVESEMLAKLRRDTVISPEEEKDLTATDRQYLSDMRHNLGVLETQQSLIAREKDLRGRLAAVVAGKTCLIGMTASRSTDLKVTPVNSLYPGVGVYSAVVNSILQRAFIYETPGWAGVLVFVAMGLGVGASAGMLSTRWSAAVSAGLLVGWTALAWALFAYLSVRVEMAGPIITGVLAYAAVTAWRHLTEERQKRHIREAFQHYLAPSVVAQVIARPDLLKLGGDRKELTVFFSDVAGFTPIAETMEPEDLVGLLNDYLSEMSQVILEEKGYLNKYEGDAIMAVFGAPLDDPDHAVAACRVALESQRRLAEFRERMVREGRPILRARIGINSGVMLVGNMGSRHRFDYTVMGDNVNVGSRLEGANKVFGTEIMIGENTWRLVKDRFETRRLGLVAVKGRVKPVGAWELLAEKGKCPPLIARILPAYERGLAAYGEQKWDEAMAAFKECLLVHPHDSPSRAYLDRCVDLRSRPAAAERWDGSFVLESK